eukprot:3959709-Prymnesium_polylepis.1
MAHVVAIPLEHQSKRLQREGEHVAIGDADNRGGRQAARSRGHPHAPLDGFDGFEQSPESAPQRIRCLTSCESSSGRWRCPCVLPHLNLPVADDVQDRVAIPLRHDFVRATGGGALGGQHV